MPQEKKLHTTTIYWCLCIDVCVCFYIKQMQWIQNLKDFVSRLDLSVAKRALKANYAFGRSCRRSVIGRLLKKNIHEKRFIFARNLEIHLYGHIVVAAAACRKLAALLLPQSDCHDAKRQFKSQKARVRRKIIHC